MRTISLTKFKGLTSLRLKNLVSDGGPITVITARKPGKAMNRSNPAPMAVIMSPGDYSKLRALADEFVKMAAEAGVV